MIDLDRADVGQAAGREGRCRAELIAGTRRQQVGAAQRRVVQGVAQRGDTAGVE